MTKYVIKKSKDPIEVGDYLINHKHFDNGFISEEFYSKSLITEELLQKLIEEGTVIKIEESTDKVDYKNIDYYVNIIAKKSNIDVHTVNSMLCTLHKIYPVACFSVLLRAIAIEFDQKYSDHISESKELYTVSVLDGGVYKISENAIIRNFNNFAAFRTAHEARMACKILRELVKTMYPKKNSGK